MTAGLATVAGTVLVAYMAMLGGEYAGHLIAASFMSAPAAIAIAKIVIPEAGKPHTLGGARIQIERDTANVIDAAANGDTVLVHEGTYPETINFNVAEPFPVMWIAVVTAIIAGSGVALLLTFQRTSKAKKRTER